MLVVTLLTFLALGSALDGQRATLSTIEMKRYFGTENSKEVPQYDIVYVEHTNNKGSRRHVTSEAIAHVSPQFKFQYLGEEIHITLQQDDSFLAPDLKAARVITDDGEYWEPIQRDCLYRGYVTKHGSRKSSAQISTCAGMVGTIYRNDDGPLFIEPMTAEHASKRDIGQGLAHLVYRRRERSDEPFCVALEMPDTARAPTPVPDTQNGEHTRFSKRLDIHVVGDKALNHAREPNTVTCLAALMNSVTHGIGWLGDLTAHVKGITVISSGSKKGPKPTSNAGTYLDNVISWAARENGEASWDVVAMMTGLDISASDGGNILGLAYVGGVCNRNYRGSVSEMRGYNAVDTVIHEIGHNLGCMHDSDGNSCDGSGYIMAAYVNCYQCEPSWSRCSKSYYSSRVAEFYCI